MVLAKPPARTPRELAETARGRAQGRSDVDGAEVAGPGFVNLRLTDGFWRAQLAAMLDAGADYGRSTSARAARSMSNMSRPTRPGPMHVGHCRGAVVGDALANMLAFAGYDVTKEYYINDAGAQIDVLGALGLSCATARRSARTIGEIPAGLYPGDYLEPVGEALAAEFGRGLLDMPEERGAGDRARAHDRRDDGDDPRRPALLNVHHEVFFSERTLHADSAKAIRRRSPS